ncbi:hypothetical protein [Evansella tamaricis]|uniref:Uncharacterized protein n=1 Tax=Evansella tamaricis TaxID=2069301 RepID=A0ABS6JI68_9BACI|nr:hypothetical protein [Evansella tamaricis]MBU9713372.1 hypothetical protein [Evansella tamaricis]
MNKKIVYACSVFLLLLFIALPFHLDATNQIVGKQIHEDEIHGLIFGENRKDRKFRPREYIRNGRNDTDPLERLE